jgi:hypothetical protein
MSLAAFCFGRDRDILKKSAMICNRKTHDKNNFMSSISMSKEKIVVRVYGVGPCVVFCKTWLFSTEPCNISYAEQ